MGLTVYGLLRRFRPADDSMELPEQQLTQNRFDADQPERSPGDMMRDYLLVPSVLGSTSSNWFTQTIQQWMLEALDWNTGAAYAFMLLILCTVFVSVAMKLFKVKLSDIAK